MTTVDTHDADLARSVRQASYMRQGFYVVVLLVALAGQVTGAVDALHIPLIAAVPAVAALELGGIVVLANADVRRRLGERAVGSRVLSVLIAGWAVAFNWLAHHDHLLGGFFAGMSALGYLVWLMHTENQRRDRLRATGDLPPTTPAYELFGHWLRHPWLTLRAQNLAKADPRLGLYDSLTAARAEVRRERRQAAIAKVLHRKIRAAVDPTTADIATATYDLDEVAARLAACADYDGLTALIAADLTAERLAPTPPDVSTVDDAPSPAEPVAVPSRLPLDPAPAATAAVHPAPRTPRQSGRTTKRQPSAAERVTKAAARNPDATPAQLAARLKLSERTVQRHLAATAVPAEPAAAALDPLVQAAYDYLADLPVPDKPRTVPSTPTPALHAV